MSTPILPFARWLSGTNQNSIPANDNALRCEVLSRLVISATTPAQPASPAQGDLYIIPAGATGAQWATFDEDDLAIFYSGSWYAFAPVDGVVVNLAGSQSQWTTGGGWASLGGGGGGLTNPMTAVADLIVGGAVAGGVAAPTRLGKGSALQGLRVNAAGTALEWATRVVAIPIACSDETTALTIGNSKVTFRMPHAMTLTAVRASLTTAQASGSIFTVDINEGGASILSTRLTIDNTEKSSTTAATAPVISDASLADDAEITIDLDQIGDGTAKGLKVYLIGVI